MGNQRSSSIDGLSAERILEKIQLNRYNINESDENSLLQYLENGYCMINGLLRRLLSTDDEYSEIDDIFTEHPLQLTKVWNDTVNLVSLSVENNPAQIYLGNWLGQLLKNGDSYIKVYRGQRELFFDKEHNIINNSLVSTSFDIEDAVEFSSGILLEIRLPIKALLQEPVWIPSGYISDKLYTSVGKCERSELILPYNTRLRILYNERRVYLKYDNGQFPKIKKPFNFNVIVCEPHFTMPAGTSRLKNRFVGYKCYIDWISKIKLLS